MPTDKLITQQKAHAFLLNKFKNQDAFTKEEFRDAVGWTVSTFNTYWTKQFLTLSIEIEDECYRVSEAFRRVASWEAFRQHVTQNRYISSNYNTSTFDNVVLFEFFMPLTNESYLRSSLDALFYKDSVLARLKTIPIESIVNRFPGIGDESNEEAIERVCDLVSKTFGGYSISHVNGRYRADALMSQEDVLNRPDNFNAPYLVDETTAIVKFIFPIGEGRSTKFSASHTYFEDISTESDNSEIVSQANQIRWLFYALFVQSIVQAINGEDEIWMLESGMRNRLHIWKIEDHEEI